MKKLFYTLFLVCPITVIAQNADSAWFVNNYTKKEVYITMRDGVRLFTSILIPKDSIEPHPILIKRTPYSCAPYGENKMPWRLAKYYYINYLKEGYIFVTQDVRGRWMSEGNFQDIRPINPNKKLKTDIDEASDTYDAIDWLVKNIPHNNGNVGVSGISYPGFYATEAALSGHPALKAVSPQAPVTDWFMGDDIHHNGAFFLDVFSFYVGLGFGAPHPKPTTEAAKGYTPFTNDNYDFYMRMGAIKNLTKIANAGTVKFWDTLMQHPNLDTFWKVRNVRAGLYNVKPAMLEVGGLFDAEDCFGAWNVFKAIEKQSPKTNNRIVEGPWFHGQWFGNDETHLGNVQFGSNTSGWYQRNIEIPFFNYYLKGKGSVDSLSKATVFFTGENEWHKFSQWPPANKNDKALYLKQNGKLDWSKSVSLSTESIRDGEGQGTRFSKYVSDPSKPVPYNEGVHSERTREYMTDDQRFASSRPDVLVFETDTLQNDITLAGPLTADLFASISTTDADFVVKLIDVFPDNFKYSDTDKYVMSGYQMLVRGDIFRGRFRNSFEKPKAFTPNKITEVKYTMPDVAHTFQKGHRIMVQVQSSWFPLVDRNPQRFVDIYHCDEKDFIKSDIKIFHSAQYASKIILPVLK